MPRSAPRRRHISIGINTPPDRKKEAARTRINLSQGLPATYAPATRLRKRQKPKEQWCSNSGRRRRSSPSCSPSFTTATSTKLKAHVYGSAVLAERTAANMASSAISKKRKVCVLAFRREAEE